MTTLYDTLQVSPGATADVIQSAYRALARTYHPDINPSAAAARRMQEINAAYAVLNDPDLRAQYDARRARQDRIRRVTRQDGSRPSAGASATATPSPAPPQTAGAISSSEPTALILTACPRLGFKDDSFHHFARPTQLHACYASGRGDRIPIYEQRVYCLQRDFIHCPRWLEASQKPASAKGQGAKSTGASDAGRTNGAYAPPTPAASSTRRAPDWSRSSAGTVPRAGSAGAVRTWLVPVMLVSALTLALGLTLVVLLALLSDAMDLRERGIPLTAPSWSRPVEPEVSPARASHPAAESPAAVPWACAFWRTGPGPFC